MTPGEAFRRTRDDVMDARIALDRAQCWLDECIEERQQTVAAVRLTERTCPDCDAHIGEWCQRDGRVTRDACAGRRVAAPWCTGDDACTVPAHNADPLASGPHRGSSTAANGPLGPTDQEGPMSDEQEPTCCVDAREADPWTEWVWHDH